MFTGYLVFKDIVPRCYVIEYASLAEVSISYLNCSITKQTKWPVRPTKTQISLCIRSVWSGSSLSAWRNIEFFRHSLSAQRRLARLGECRVHVVLLVLSCCGSFVFLLNALADMHSRMAGVCYPTILLLFHMHQRAFNYGPPLGLFSLLHNYMFAASLS